MPKSDVIHVVAHAVVGFHKTLWANYTYIGAGSYLVIVRVVQLNHIDAVFAAVGLTLLGTAALATAIFQWKQAEWKRKWKAAEEEKRVIKKELFETKWHIEELEGQLENVKTDIDDKLGEVQVDIQTNREETKINTADIEVNKADIKINAADIESTTAVARSAAVKTDELRVQVNPEIINKVLDNAFIDKAVQAAEDQKTPKPTDSPRGEEEQQG